MNADTASAAALDLVDHIRLVASVAANALGRFDNDQLWDKTEPAYALAVHTAAKELAAFVRELQNETDRLLIASLDGQRRTEINGQTVEVRRAYKRTWDTPLLAGAVAACVLQGERLAQVDEVVSALVKAARMEWRVTALEELGISDEAYCTKELGRATVTVV